MKVEDEGISLKGTILDPLLEQKDIKLREIKLNEMVSQPKACNEINNSKYSILTFLPLVLYYQFQHFFNLYFLGLTITQFVPALKVGFMINYIGPLSMVVFLSICKEAYDDLLRHQRDRQINNQLYQILTKEGLMNKKAGNLSIGFIVQVNKDERVPADLVVLKTDNSEGNVFIRTDQLDGETDWKLRKSIKKTQIMDEELLSNSQGIVQVEEPHLNIYSFKGLFTDEESKESLGIENVIWANTVLATGQIYGLVVYNGSETKMVMNSKKAKTKKGIFDKEVDRLSKLSFLIMIILAAIITIFSSPPLDLGYVLQMYMRYLILVSNIIPISMRVNLEFAKLIYSIRINKDNSIEGTITRNSNIPESLGRISYLLTDKTGTLTQNEMIFKRLSMENEKYTTEAEDLKRIQHQLSEQVKHSKLRDFFTCLSVCHNVTPVDDEYGNRTYQAQSPDEIALVKFAEEQGFCIKQRSEKEIVINVQNVKKERFQILNCFPFSSENKRMGIIVKNNIGQIHFFVKGADIVLRELIPQQLASFVDEECENLARSGLRTLVLAHKMLLEEEYQDWLKKYTTATQLIDNREQTVQRIIGELENQLEFIGITGVEDKLQEDVAHTIENMYNAGINIWMLTGDKMETAICIAILSGLKHPTQNFIIMKDVTDEIQMSLILQNLEANSNNVLVIDGTSLQEALNGFEQTFMKAAMNCPSVICCRCSPTQKTIMTELLKKYSGLVVATIGDGGNDVGMIQSADVGIGIEGKEGKQAALASDFSVLKFNALNILLLWHGRLSYKRSALLSQFIIHRGLLIATVQAIFMFFFYFLSISLFSGLLMLGYSTIFTMFPVFCIIYDEDVKQSIALRFPPLYKSLQQGRFLNTKTFLIWLWKAAFQGFIIMICALLLIKQAFLRLETTVFTCLIFTQYAMTLTELESLHITMIISNLLSVVIYLLTLILFPHHLMISELDAKFFGWVILILIMSWLPLYLIRRILKLVDPSDYEKLMEHVSRETINTN